MADVRYIGIGEETTVGTIVDADIFLDILSESIKPSHGYINLDSVRNRNVTTQVPGKFSSVGDIKTYLIPTGITLLLKWGLGKLTSSAQQGGTAAYLHTIDVDDVLKTFTTRIGINLKERIIAACQVSTLEIASSIADGILGLTVGVLGGEETSGTIDTPDYGTLAERKPFEVMGASVKLKTAEQQSRVEALVVRLNNNIPDRWTHESRFPKRSTVGKRTIEGTVDLIFNATTEYDDFLAGTPFAIDYKAEGELADDPYKYTFELNLPKCVFQEGTVPHISGRDELRITGAPWKALYDTVTSRDMQIKIINKETTF